MSELSGSVQGDEMGYNTIHTHFTGTTGLLEVGSHGPEDYSSHVPGVGRIDTSNEYWQVFTGSEGK